MKPTNNFYIYVNPPPAPPAVGPLPGLTQGDGFRVDCENNSAALTVGDLCWLSRNPASVFNKAMRVRCTALAPPSYSFVEL